MMESCQLPAVLSVTPEGEGETVAVVLALPSAEGKAPRRVRICLLTEQYADLAVQAEKISLERAQELLEAGKLCAAIQRGIGMLAYGNQSVRRLAYKLTAKGVEREIAETAAAYLAAKGYIRETDTALLRAREGLRKGWGLMRIREDLRAHGFDAEAIEAVAEDLSEVDFTENCEAMIRKRYGDIPAERPERQKLTAAMLRLGYEPEEIREAMRRIVREKSGS